MTVAASRQPPGSTAIATIDSNPRFELVWLSKTYQYRLADYSLLAPLFYQRLRAEANLLRHEIQGHYEIAIHYLEADGSFAAFTVDLLRRAKSKLTGKQSPQAKDFDRLSTELDGVANALRNGSADDYELLRRTGLEYQRIRGEARNIAKSVRGEIESRIDTAATTVAVLQETEDLSAWLWDQYLKGVSVGSPAKLFAGRVGVIMVRAGARYVGEAAAEATIQQRWREVFAFIRKELPGPTKDFLLEYLKKGFPNPSSPTTLEKFAVELIGLEIWFAWRTFDFFAFDAPKIKTRGRDPSDEYLNILADELPPQILASLSAVVGARIAGSKLDENKKKLFGTLADVLGVMISTGVSEFLRVRRKANEESKEFWDLLSMELGTILYRLLKAVGLKLAEGPVDRWMKAKAASDRSRDGSDDLTDARFWRALILRVHLELGAGSHPPGHRGTDPPAVRAPATNDAGEPAQATTVAAAVRPPLPAEIKTPPPPAAIPKRATRRKAEAATPLAKPTATTVSPGRPRGVLQGAELRWERDGGLRVSAPVRSPRGKRAGYERRMLRSATELGLKEMERAHALGPGTGHESRFGIRYAPKEVNQQLQRLGIEQYIRDFQSQKARDVALRMTAVVYSHQPPHQKFLREIQYQLHAVRNGKKYLIFEASIEVDLDRKTRIAGEEVLDPEPFLKPLPTRPRRQNR